MFKFVVLTALVACAAAAPGHLVVPVAHSVVAAPAVAVAHPVATSSVHSYRAPPVKALPVVHAAPVIATPLVAAHPVVAHPVVAHPTVIKTTQQVVAHPAPVVHAPVVHAAPLAVHAHGLPVATYANHYNVHPVAKTVVAAPLTLVH